MKLSRAKIFRTKPSLIAVVLVAGLWRAVLGQESPSVTPASSPNEPTPRTVHLSFVPPPIEGTISLGIYDAAGKLVRVLHRESTTDDFTIGHDALMTEWDAKDDAGADLPAGKYHARGYAVGALSVEGVDYFFNDWVTDDNSLHVRRASGTSMKDNQLRVNVELVGGAKATLVCDQQTGAVQEKLPVENSAKCEADAGVGANVVHAVDCAPGKDETLWLVDDIGGGLSEVKQLSKAGDLLRHLGFSSNEPQPISIAASTADDRIFLVEQTRDGSTNRLRALSLIAKKTAAGTAQAISDWKIDFEKTIVAHQNFSVENGKPVAAPSAGKNASEKLMQKLQANPLQPNEAARVELAVGFDADGSFLKTTDGLPLKTISDTPDLSRALLIASGKNAIDVFQDDGAVVEQYRISGADEMMAFDCGDFELK